MADITVVNKLIREKFIAHTERISAAVYATAEDPDIQKMMKEVIDEPFTITESEIEANSELVMPLPESGITHLDAILFGPSKKVNGNGEYYKQGDTGSCIVWAIANAVKSLNQNMSTENLSAMLAMGFKGQLMSTFNIDRMTEQPGSIREDYDWVGLVDRHVPQFPYAQSVEYNALKIQEVIDNGGVLVMGVDAGYLYRDADFNETGGHAIVINGYEISDDLRMKVQVVDSNFGMAWVPIEIISLGNSTSQRVIYPNS